MSFVTRYAKYAPLAIAFMVFAVLPAEANNGATNLPWEGPLQIIQQSLTGKVATAIAVISLFAAGAALVFGDEMSNFVKRVLIGVMAIALLIAGNGLLNSLNITGHSI